MWNLSYFREVILEIIFQNLSKNSEKLNYYINVFFLVVTPKIIILETFIKYW